MSLVESSKLVQRLSPVHILLCDLAKDQYGDLTSVYSWWIETSNHGDSYHGFDLASGRWLQVDLENKVDTHKP